jgi:diguanylate cyclase (GGDEF)-like protein
VFIADVASFDGLSICDEIKAATPHCPVVLVFPPEDEEPEARAAAAGADAYLVGPLTRGHVLSCVKGMLRIHALLSQVAALEKQLEQRGAKAVPNETLARDFDFAKRVLLGEVRRSRRYRYPVSFVLVTLDNFRKITDKLDARAAGRFIAEMMTVVAQATRDVDLPMLYAEDRFLVFLPHTAAKGAMRVARRIVDRIAERSAAPRTTASAGVAVYEGAGKVSFASLLRDATDSARRAQISGGNRVVLADVSPDA